MATILIDLWPGPYALPLTNYAAPTVIAGTNFSFPALLFDAATDETVVFPFRAHNYGSGNLTLDLEWYADTASTNDVIFGAQLAAITPNTDTTDIEAKALDTAAVVTDTHLGTTGQRLHRASITIVALDALAAGDLCWLSVYRDANAAGDTMAGDAALIAASLHYSDT